MGQTDGRQHCLVLTARPLWTIQAASLVHAFLGTVMHFYGDSGLRRWRRQDTCESSVAYRRTPRGGGA